MKSTNWLGWEIHIHIVPDPMLHLGEGTDRKVYKHRVYYTHCPHVHFQIIKY